MTANLNKDTSGHKHQLDSAIPRASGGSEKKEVKPIEVEGKKSGKWRKY